MISSRSCVLLLALALSATGTAACGDDPAAPSARPTPSVSPTPSTNGVDTMSAEKALAASAKAYLAAPTVHVKGTIVDGETRIALDIRQTLKGDSVGTVILDGAKVKVMTIGTTAYISGDRKFLTEAIGPDGYQTLKGKWFKTKLTAKDFEQFAIFTDRKQFADNMLPKDLLAGDRQVVRGIPTFRFKDFGTGGYDIALQGEPYPVRLAGDDGETAMNLDFLDYGKPVNLSPPPAAKVIAAPE